jgi:hypothetical protein
MISGRDRDKRRDAVRMEFIARTLRDKSVIDALAARRVTRMGIPEAKDQMSHDLDQLARDAIALVDKYSPGGSRYEVREKLQRLRHERLHIGLKPRRLPHRVLPMRRSRLST